MAKGTEAAVQAKASSGNMRRLNQRDFLYRRLGQAVRWRTRLGQKRIIVALTGASGATYGHRLLEILRQLNVETHGIMTRGADANVRIETSRSREDVLRLCTYSYDEKDIGAKLASGSFINDGMVIVPCSGRTLAGVAHGFSDNLVLRAADVCLKEQRPLAI